MATLDILYLSLSAGFLIFVGFFGYLVTNAVKTMRVLREVLYDISDTTSDVREFKNQIKFGVLGILSTIFKRR